MAINLDERLVPVSAGIIELSKERYDIKPSLVDRILYHGAKFNDKAVVKNLRKSIMTARCLTISLSTLWIRPFLTSLAILLILL